MTWSKTLKYILGISFGSAVGFVLYVASVIFIKPKLNPASYLKSKKSNDKPVVVCCGDSITHGSM